MKYFKIDAVVLCEGYADYDPRMKNLVMLKNPKGGEEADMGTHFFWKRRAERPVKYQLMLVRKWK